MIRKLHREHRSAHATQWKKGLSAYAKVPARKHLVRGRGVHRYEVASLLDRIEAIQRDVLRYIDEEPRMVQMQGMTDVLIELRRSLTVVRRKLKRINEQRGTTPAPGARLSGFHLGMD
jgi:hypothetical protein